MLLQNFRIMLARRHNVRAHFWQSCSNYTQQITGLILSILLARLLAPEDFGNVAYISAVLILFMLPATWSLAPQVISEVRANPEIVSDALYYSRRLALPRIFLAVTACIFLFVTQGIAQAAIGCIFSIPLVAGDFLAIMRSTMEGRGDFKMNFFDSVITLASSALIAVPAAWLGAGAWALVMPTLPLFMAQLVLFKRMSGISFKPTAPRSQRIYLHSATKLWLAGCSDAALLRCDKFLLGQASGMVSLGDYNRAFNFSPFAARALNSFMAGPAISSLTAAVRRETRRSLIVKASVLLGVAGAANFILWWFFSDSLVPWLFGKQWIHAIPVFEAMAPLSWAISAAYLPTTLAIANRAYGTLALVRTLTLVAFIVFALLFRAQMSAVLMAWLIQGTLVIQGTFLSLAMSPLFSANCYFNNNTLHRT